MIRITEGSAIVVLCNIDKYPRYGCHNLNFMMRLPVAVGLLTELSEIRKTSGTRSYAHTNAGRLLRHTDLQTSD